MPQIDPVILQLRADVATYRNELRSTTTLVERSLGQQERAVVDLEQQMGRSSARIGGSLRGIRQSLLSSASLLAGAFGANELKNLADGYTRFTNQLKIAGLESGNLSKAQNDLFGIAQKYGVGLEGIGTLYGRLAQTSGALGASQGDLLKFTNGVGAALKIQGGAASETSGALLQLSQALGSPIVRAEEFNSINEGARPILQAVANGIDKYKGSVAALRNDVIAGTVTSKDFFQGFLKGSAALEAQAAKANLTIGASFTILNNALGKYIGETDQALSATARVSQGITALANNLDVIVPALALIGVAFGARFVAGNQAIQGLIASSALYTQALTTENLVLLGGRAAAAQKAEYIAAAAATEVASIEATITARRAEQAVLAETITATQALAASKRAEATLAATRNFGPGVSTVSAAAGKAQASATREASAATATLIAARQRLTIVNAELAAAEGSLAGAQAVVTVATEAATVATAELTLVARAGALASRLFAGSLALVGGPVGVAIIGIAALVAGLIYFRTTTEDAATTARSLNENGANLAAQLELLAQASLRASGGIASAGNSAATATGKMRAFAGQVGEAANKLYDLAKAQRRQAVLAFTTAKVTADQDAANAQARIDARKASSPGIPGRGFIPTQSQTDADNRDRQLIRIATAQSVTAYRAAQQAAALPLAANLTESQREGGRDVSGDLARVTRDLVVARKRGLKAQIDTLEAQKYELTQYKAYRAQGLSPQSAHEASGSDASKFRNAAAGAQGDRDAKASAAAGKKTDRTAAAAAAKSQREAAAAARDTLADDRAYAGAERQSNNEIASAKAELSGSAQARAQIEKDRLESDRISRNDDIAEQAKQGRFGEGAVAKARVLELQTLNDQRATLEKQVVDLHDRQRVEKEALDATLSGLDNQRDLLTEESNLADTAAERRAKELDLLDLQKREEVARLRAVLAADSSATTAEKKAAQDRLAIVDRLYDGRKEVLDRQNEGPLATYRRGFDDPKTQVEQAVVDKLKAVDDAITDAAAKTLGIKDPFLKSLLQIFLQQNVLKPLYDALSQAQGGGGGIGGFLGSIVSIASSAFGGGGGGGLSSVTSSFGDFAPISAGNPVNVSTLLPGFASGGSMQIGGRAGVDRNLLSLNGQPIARVGRGETLNVVPNARAVPSGGGNTTVIHAPQFNLRGAIVTKELYADMQRISDDSSSRASTAAYKQAVRDAPAAVQRANRYGTSR